VLQNLALSYDDFEKLRLHVTTPLQLSSLPGLEMELNWGEFCGRWFFLSGFISLSLSLSLSLSPRLLDMLMHFTMFPKIM